MSERAFFIDYSRCIGCQACVQACEECDTHRGRSLIHLETVARRDSVQTAPQVCMHCVDPICAEVCPADAIKQMPDGVVQSSLTARCIGCSNCVLACPFGVPKYYADIDQMMKCDMCYDRTSTGRGPMCATVCPSQALAFTTIEEIMRTRRGSAVNEWQFGGESVRTKVFVLVPIEVKRVDVRLIQIGNLTRTPLRSDPTVRPKPDTTYDLTVRLKPDTTYDLTVRLKPDTTDDSTVRLKPDTTDDSTVRLKPDTTYDPTVRLKPDTTYDPTVRLKPDTTYDPYDVAALLEGD